jgi:hypothetical protein
MNALTQLYENVAVALTDDPMLLLATAVATFDPLWNASDEDDFDGDVEPVERALQVTRSAFPDIYAEAIGQMQAGSSESELDRLLCQGISAKGIPLDDFDYIGWGIPLLALGIDLEDPALYSVYTDLFPILALFDIRPPAGNASYVDVPNWVYPVGRALANYLTHQADKRLEQVGWALAWLFSCSGNTLIDFDDNALAEIPPLTWSTDDVAFAIEVIEEADDMMRDVQAGMERLRTLPEWKTELERNIGYLKREWTKKGKLDEHALQLDWTGIGSCTDGNAIADSQFLQLRGDAA